MGILAPLFHIGLGPLLLANIAIFIFKKRTSMYVLLFFVTLFIGQAEVINIFSILADEYQGTQIEHKYSAYVSEAGQNRMELRYRQGAQNYNIKARALSIGFDIVNYIFFPLIIGLVYLRKNKLLRADEYSLTLFNTSVALWSVSNLMLNISQGERFLFIANFIAYALLVYIYFNSNDSYKLLNAVIYLFIPVLLFFGLGTLYASNDFISIMFYISNVITEPFLR